MLRSCHDNLQIFVNYTHTKSSQYAAKLFCTGASNVICAHVHKYILIFFLFR